MISQRIRVYKYLAEQKYGTLQDIQNGSGSQASSEAFRVSLYQFGLSRFSFPGIRHGVWHICSQSILDELFTYFPEEPLYRVSPVRLYEVEHALGMNRVRAAVCRQPGVKVLQWYSEHHIRALPPPLRFGLSWSLLPDAMFVGLRSDGTQKTFYIEYERSLKAPGRYRHIFSSYLARTDVTERSVIYVCQDPRVRRELERISARMAATKGVFQFADMEALCGREEEKENRSG
ncbi:MAG: hypothetical protein GX606_00460 [Elusimicrobia bacterium]|nr:hypothetical protein [Elusimicrobiota bacterium]